MFKRVFKDRGIKKRVAKHSKKVLKKEVNLPVPLPDNKVGRALKKKRRAPLAKYFSEAWAELRKVTWPSRKETLKLTLAVALFTAFFTVFTALLDLGITNVVERILL